MSALNTAWALQRVAAEAGFDWDSLEGLWEKLLEEVDELREATQLGPEAMAEELGDLLFMVVNLGRHLGVAPEAALAAANAKFARRYAYVVAEPETLPPIGAPGRLEAMEARWQEAKQAERARAIPHLHHSGCSDD